MISEYVQSILNDNHFTVVKVLRYGPRFATIKVEHQGKDGLFKIALPRSEQQMFRPADYYWTFHDTTIELEKRLIREAFTLQYLSQEISRQFEPQIIAVNTSSPAWSLRTYVKDVGYEMGVSYHAFRKSFYENISPRDMVQFFNHLHVLSDDLPESVRSLMTPRSDLDNERKQRQQLALAYCQSTASLQSYHDDIQRCFAEADAVRPGSRLVITHGEPYAPHFFGQHAHIGLIDWENAHLYDPTLDLSILYPRLFTNPPWQLQFKAAVAVLGYFDDYGQLQWNSSLLYECIYQHQWLNAGNTLFGPTYDQQALEYFSKTIAQTVNEL